MRRRSSKPLHQVKIARERIALLLKEADDVVKKDPALARRYARLAKKIGMRYNVRLRREQKVHVCKKCHAYLKASVTAQHIVKNGKITIVCKNCGTKKKIFIRQPDASQ